MIKMYAQVIYLVQSGQGCGWQKLWGTRLRSLPPPNKQILALYFEIFFLLGGGRLFSEFSLFYSQVSYGGEFQKMFLPPAALP